MKLLSLIFGLILLKVHPGESFEYYTEKPDFIRSCNLNGPDFAKCATESTQDLVTHLMKGDLPEITEKIGSLDPLKIRKVTFSPESNQAVSLSAEFDNMILKGVKDLQIKDSRVNKKDFTLLQKAHLPKVHLSGNYKMNGKVLLLPLSGSGKFSVDLDNLDIKIRMTMRLYDKGNLTFYNLTALQVDMDISGLKIHFDNLFNGQSPEIERSTNDFFNENWKELFEAIRPIVMKTVEDTLLNTLRNVFDMFPASFLIDGLPKVSEIYSTNKES